MKIKSGQRIKRKTQIQHILVQKVLIIPPRSEVIINKKIKIKVKEKEKMMKLILKERK